MHALASLARWGNFMLIFRHNPPFARPIPADFLGQQAAVRSNFFHQRFDFIEEDLILFERRQFKKPTDEIFFAFRGKDTKPLSHEGLPMLDAIPANGTRRTERIASKTCRRGEEDKEI